MPVIHVRALPQPAIVDIQRVLKDIACAVAIATSMPAHRVFATWETIQNGWFVEGETAAATQQKATHPPIVSLTAFEGRSSETIRKMITAIADTLAKHLPIEAGNAFISYIEAKSGQIFTGGAIKER